MATIEEILNEGLVFFKHSKRLTRLLEKIESKTFKIKKQEPKGVMIMVVEKLKEAIEIFKKLEEKYKGKEKKKTREGYEKAKEKYKDLLLLLKQDETKKAFKAIGLASALVALTTIVGLVINDYYMTHDILISGGKTTTTLTRAGLERMVEYWARREGVPKEIAFSMVDRESEWNPKAHGHNTNGTTDGGLFQLNSSNSKLFQTAFWSDQKEPFDQYNPEHSAIVGIRFFKSLLDTE